MREHRDSIPEGAGPAGQPLHIFHRRCISATAIMTQEEPSDGAARFVRYAQLRQMKGIPFSRVHIDRLEKAGRFPRRVRLGPNTVAWREDELDDWSAARSNKRAWSGTKTRARAHVTIEKGDDQLTRIRKIHEGFKKLGELTNADWVLEHARAGDFDPLLEHLGRGGNIPAEMKHFLASTIDALLQRKPVRKSKPVTAATSLRNSHIACFVLQLEDLGVPPSGAQ